MTLSTRSEGIQHIYFYHSISTTKVSAESKIVFSELVLFVLPMYSTVRHYPSENLITTVSPDTGSKRPGLLSSLCSLPIYHIAWGSAVHASFAPVDTPTKE
jgi:hypothetical protein